MSYRHEPSQEYWEYRKKLSDQANKLKNARINKELKSRRCDPRNQNDLSDRRKEIS